MDEARRESDARTAAVVDGAIGSGALAGVAALPLCRGEEGLALGGGGGARGLDTAAGALKGEAAEAAVAAGPLSCGACGGGGASEMLVSESLRDRSAASEAGVMATVAARCASVISCSAATN